MNLNRLRILILEMFKIMNNSIPDFMKIFCIKSNTDVLETIQPNPEIPEYNQETFGSKSLPVFLTQNLRQSPASYKVL